MFKLITVVYPDGSKTVGMPYLAVLGYSYFPPVKGGILVEVVEISGDGMTIWVEPTDKKRSNYQ